MILSYENLDNIYLSKNGKYWLSKDTKTALHYHNSCDCCKEPYLGAKSIKTCCRSCSSTINNGMEGRFSDKNPFFNKKHSKRVIKIISNSNKGRKHSKETIELYRLIRKGSGNPNWRGGIKYDLYPDTWNDNLRRNIRNRDKFKCQEPFCERKSYILDVHHIDYDKLNCSENNLITLCRSCHSKTNFKRKWWTEWYNIIVERKYVHI